MSARFLFYSNEMVGLGHLRRTLLMAECIAERNAEATSLILTGSLIEPFLPLPDHVDTVKLPGRARDHRGRHHAARLSIGLQHLQALRSSIAIASARAFDPDVVVVDKLPLGLGGELQPTLDVLRTAGHARLVLGLRDIEDSPERVREAWGDEMRETIERYYDAVLVYGPDGTPDAIECMDWGDLGVDVTHVGYLGGAVCDRGPSDLPHGYLLATAGGGGDGFELLARFAEAVRLDPPACPIVVVAGPLMAPYQVQALRALLRGLDAHLFEFRPDMGRLMAGARAVVCMAGYNTVSEVMRSRKPALLVPRVRPSQEQLIRATELSRRGLQAMLHPDELTPRRLRAEIGALLRRERPVANGYSVSGAHNAAEMLLQLNAESRASVRRRARAA
jgi:predicted glycosyltransferase